MFSLGLLSKQINTAALLKIKKGKESLFSQKENIGTLSFNSTYLPLRNNQGLAFGYLNIQNFNKQRELEMQIQQFIVAIMNVFLLLLCIAIIISLLISNRLVQPLKQLQLKVKQIQFSNRNQHIQYTNRDEIGEIVSAYNGKLDELELAIKQLKANERESAWRDVAKQVAHEIKNPLGGIRGAAQLLEYELPDKALHEYTQVIIKESDRLQSLVDRLLAPHRKAHIDDFLNIHEVLERVRSLVLAEFPSGLKIKRNYDISLPDLLGDKEALIQAVLNVVHNAAQALRSRIEQGDAEIELTTRVVRNVTINKQRYKLALDLHVIDNGPGIPDEIKDKIFFPLVSGKEGGSGLGLTLAQTYVQQNYGFIGCTSKPGTTDFQMQLPFRLKTEGKQ